jgi:hypothetical protein
MECVEEVRWGGRTIIIFQLCSFRVGIDNLLQHLFNFFFFESTPCRDGDDGVGDGGGGDGSGGGVGDGGGDG